MVGADNLNGTCWCTTPCLCPTLLFLMTDGSLPHGKVWVECMDNFRGLNDKQKDGKGRKKLNKLLLQHDLMSRQLVHARVVHLESSVLFSAGRLKKHTYKCVYIHMYKYCAMKVFTNNTQHRKGWPRLQASRGAQMDPDHMAALICFLCLRKLGLSVKSIT